MVREKKTPKWNSNRFCRILSFFIDFRRLFSCKMLNSTFHTLNTFLIIKVSIRFSQPFTFISTTQSTFYQMNEFVFYFFICFFFCKQVGKFEFRTLKCEFDKRATRSLSSLQIIEREKDIVLNVASQNWCAIEVGRGNEENDIALDTNRNSYQLITMKWTLHIWVIV